MNPRTVTTAGRALVFSTDVSMNQIQAFAMTMLKAQLDAIKVNPDPASIGHFKQIISSLESLGWMITPLGDYEYKPVPGTIKPIRIFADAMATYVSQFLPLIPKNILDPSRYLPEVETALRKAPPQLEKILDQLWGASSYGGSIHSFISGPLHSMFNAPFVMLNYIALDLSAASWHALLDDRPSSQITFKSAANMMLLNMIKYEQRKDQIALEIKETILGHIQTVQLDL